VLAAPPQRPGAFGGMDLPDGARRASFDTPDEQARRDGWRGLDDQVHMVGLGVDLEDFHAERLARGLGLLTEQAEHGCREDPLPPLDAPDDVEPDAGDGGASSSQLASLRPSLPSLASQGDGVSGVEMVVSVEHVVVPIEWGFAEEVRVDRLQGSPHACCEAPAASRQAETRI